MKGRRAGESVEGETGGEAGERGDRRVRGLEQRGWGGGCRGRWTPGFGAGGSRGEGRGEGCSYAALRPRTALRARGRAQSHDPLPTHRPAPPCQNQHRRVAPHGVAGIGSVHHRGTWLLPPVPLHPPTHPPTQPLIPAFPRSHFLPTRRRRRSSRSCRGRAARPSSCRRAPVPPHPLTRRGRQQAHVTHSHARAHTHDAQQGRHRAGPPPAVAARRPCPPRSLALPRPRARARKRAHTHNPLGRLRALA